MKRSRPKKPAVTPDSREPRIEVHDSVGVVITAEEGGEEMVGWVQNLNTGGMSLWTEMPLTPEALYDFRLVIEGEAEEVNAQGWVVYVNEVEAAIQFDDLEPKSEAVIQRTLDRLAVEPCE